MRDSMPRILRTGYADSGRRRLGVSLFLSATLLFQGCGHEAEKYLKMSVIGHWEEVHGTKETLQFNADGTLNMRSRFQNQDCRYDFPDGKDMRLDCAPPGATPRPHLCTISVTADDKLLIGDSREIGTYERK